MKNKIITSVVALALATPAHSGIVDLYVGLSAGMGSAIIDNSGNTSQNFGIMAGIDVPIFRAEIEYSFLTTNHFDAHLGMANVYLKAPIPVITPYVGGGFGRVFGGTNGVESGPAWQGMIGLQMDAQFLPLLFDLEGRVLHVSEIVPGHSMTDVSARVKVRYRF
ncbi:MAG: hypothetical protein FWC83_00960 [Alphaproteobacteria bacterium]|nr:hypothetical protein [Alphaproteobacteria bacterium]